VKEKEMLYRAKVWLGISLFATSVALAQESAPTYDVPLGTGHLFDYVVMTPVFLGKKPVAIFASTCHVIDVGGVGMSARAYSSFEEGTLIPHLKMRKAGEINEELLSIILANSRNPIEVRGDLLSLVSFSNVTCFADSYLGKGHADICVPLRR